MSTINKDSRFLSYSLTEEEALAGCHFTDTQIQFIQNQIAIAAESILNLVPDPTSYATFIQQDSHLKGQVFILQYLLDCSKVAQAELLNKAIEINNQ